MDFSIYSVNSLTYILVFAIISICKGINYDAQLAIKMKEMDMAQGLKSLEYGEKLTSLEEARMYNKSKLKAIEDDENSVEIKPLAQFISLQPSSKPSTRCTTEKPLPKLSPWFLPNETYGNEIGSDVEVDQKKKYDAPDIGMTPKFYVDDE